MKRPRWAWLWLLLAIVLAFGVEYPWGQMTDHSHWSKVEWIPFSRYIRPFDMLGNILLFLPLGWGAAQVFQRRPGIAAALLAFVVSVSGETLQVFAHNRFPSATDVTCNVAGAAIAARLARRASDPC